MSEDKPHATKAMVTINDGDMVAENPEGLLKIAQYHLKSGMLPKHYNSIEKIITASTWARELGLKPLTAMRQMAVINGSPSLYGDLPLSLVAKHPDFEWIEEYFVDDEFNEICASNKNLNKRAYAAICITKRKGNPKPHEAFFTMDDKALAGLGGNTWSKYTKDMLLYRARARNLKSSFPDALNGAPIAEYDYSVMPQIEGIVIDSVNHDGGRSRMEQLKDQFLKPEASPSEEDREEYQNGSIPKVDEPEVSVDRPRGNTQKKKSKKKPPIQVGGESDTVATDGEVQELWPTDQP